MSDYLRDAVSKVYGRDDDFILIGLTGRTGSGCTTAAKILGSDLSEIGYDLKGTTDSLDNEKRKERIVRRFVESNWVAFDVIRVSSIFLVFVFDGRAQLSRFCDLFDVSKRVDVRRALIPLLRRYKLLSRSGGVKGNREFYCNLLPSALSEIRKTVGEGEFTKVFQEVGSNLRKSGSPFGGTREPSSVFRISEKINQIVKSIHKENQSLEKRRPTHIVIDAIRNPLEAVFFQDRYSSFYLVSITVAESQRLARLRACGYSDGDISIIDKAEYSPYDASDENGYYRQDIMGCIQRADIHIWNADCRDLASEYHDLANQLLKFVSLIKRPGLVTPSAVERCMQIAFTAKLNSGCISRQVGAVVVDKNFSVRSIGWNDAPHGQVPCNLRCRDDLIKGRDPEAYSDFEKGDGAYLREFKERSNKYFVSSIESKGLNKAFCFKSEYNAFTGERNQVHTRSLHAEENAFLQLAKYGSVGVMGGKLFTTASPCELCSKKAYQLGIDEIYYVDPYPGISISHVISSGNARPKLILFSGAIGRAFHRLYTPVFSYKDELSALSG